MINIDIKIKTSNKMLTKKKMQVKVTDGLTTLDVKNQIKSTISLPSEIISEEFYFGTYMAPLMMQHQLLLVV